MGVGPMAVAAPNSSPTRSNSPRLRCAGQHRLGLTEGCGRGKCCQCSLANACRCCEEGGLGYDLDGDKGSGHRHDWTHNYRGTLGHRILDASTNDRAVGEAEEGWPRGSHHAERVSALGQDCGRLKSGQPLRGGLLGVHEISMPLLQRCKLKRAGTKCSVQSQRGTKAEKNQRKDEGSKPCGGQALGCGCSDNRKTLAMPDDRIACCRTGLGSNPLGRGTTECRCLGR